MRLAELTERETDVARLVAHGYTNDEIAEALTLEYGTVATHVMHINQKWRTHNRTQVAVLYAKYANCLDKLVEYIQAHPRPKADYEW